MAGDSLLPPGGLPLPSRAQEGKCLWAGLCNPRVLSPSRPACRRPEKTLRLMIRSLDGSEWLGDVSSWREALLLPDAQLPLHPRLLLPPPLRRTSPGRPLLLKSHTSLELSTGRGEGEGEGRGGGEEGGKGGGEGREGKGSRTRLPPHNCTRMHPLTHTGLETPQDRSVWFPPL